MVDLTEIAKEAGLMLRTLLSPAAWEIFNDGGQIQARELQKRLSMMLSTLHIALTQRKGLRKNVIYFSTFLGERGDVANKLTLKAAVENHASGKSVITIMLLSEGGGGKISEEEEVKN